MAERIIKLEKNPIKLEEIDNLMQQISKRSIEIEEYFFRTKQAVMLAAKSGKTAIIEGSMINNLQEKPKQDDSKKLLDFRIKAIETKMNQMQMKLVSLP